MAWSALQNQPGPLHDVFYCWPNEGAIDPGQLESHGMPLLSFEEHSLLQAHNGTAQGQPTAYTALAEAVPSLGVFPEWGEAPFRPLPPCPLPSLEYTETYQQHDTVEQFDVAELSDLTEYFDLTEPVDFITDTPAIATTFPPIASLHDFSYNAAAYLIPPSVTNPYNQMQYDHASWLSFQTQHSALEPTSNGHTNQTERTRSTIQGNRGRLPAPYDYVSAADRVTLARLYSGCPTTANALEAYSNFLGHTVQTSHSIPYLRQLPLNQVTTCYITQSLTPLPPVSNQLPTPTSRKDLAKAATPLPSRKSVKIDKGRGDNEKKKKKYRCRYPNCRSKGFGRPYELERHYRGAHSHTSEKFWCSENACARSAFQGTRPFPRKDKKKDHERAVHGLHGTV